MHNLQFSVALSEAKKSLEKILNLGLKRLYLDLMSFLYHNIIKLPNNKYIAYSIGNSNRAFEYQKITNECHHLP